MQQPWGLSGPQFLVVYSIALPVSALFVVGVRALVGRLGRREIGRSLTPYEVAYLAGGADRVLIVGAAELMSSGQVHRSRDGRLTTDSGYRFRAPIEKAVARNMRVGASWADRSRKFSEDPTLRDLVARLRADGLVLTGRGRLLWSALLLVPIAVWVTGLIRAINGVRLGRPATDLIVLLILSAGAVVLFLIWWARRTFWPSARGALLLRRMRRRYTSGGDQRDGYRTIAGIPLTTIAVLGVAAVGDSALLGLISGPASLNSCSLSSGSGCGGGGCGGGGGGGGCGG
jgi:uncharacterized protein (TIGR04222 family)